MQSTSPTRRRPAEEGYILIWVMFLLVIFTIAISVAAPAIGKEIERDRERETMQRGKQYIRAVQLYYRKFHAYPPNADALVNTNQIRFLRKKYIDPTTGKQDWKPIMFGQAKTQTMGFWAAVGRRRFGGRLGDGRYWAEREWRDRRQRWDRIVGLWVFEYWLPFEYGRDGTVDGRAGRYFRKFCVRNRRDGRDGNVRHLGHWQPGQFDWGYRRQRADVWRCRDRWLFARQPKTVDPDLQEEEPL